MFEKKIEPKDKYNVYSRPNKDKIYTVQEIADLCECSCDVIRNVTNRLNIPHEYVTKNKARVSVYPYSSVKIIMEHQAEKEKKRKEIALKKDKAKENKAEDLKKHPLVTDVRCFDLNWWPDVIPDCFKEAEECTV